MTTFTDDLGRAVTVRAPLRRIVSLSPAATENLFAVGAGALVVGVTTADDYPPGPPVSKLPRIGDFYKPSYERIRALAPDLIVVESATLRRADLDPIQERAGAPVYGMQSRTLADVSRQLLRLGEVTGHKAQGKHVSQMTAERAANIAKQAAAKPVRGRRPTVFIQIDPSALYAAGPGTFIDDLVRLAGGVNIVRGTTPFPLVSRELLLASDPDWYFQTIPGGSRGVPALEPPLRASLTAVKTGHVRFLDANTVSRPTPRLVDGLAELARVLHE